MLQLASTPGRRSQNPRQHRPAIAIVALAAGALTGTTAWGQDAALEPALERSLDRIEASFRDEDAAGLRPLLPEDSKVLIALDSFEQSRRWYGSDQVVLLFERVFNEIEVTGFTVDRGRGALSGTNVYFVPASWSSRARTYGVRHCRLQLMLAREGGGIFRIREIKEIP